MGRVVICGAGIAGIALAERLAVHHGVRDIVVVDDRPPLSLTSDKSTEAYRNYWPGPDPCMIQLVDRSLDLLEVLARQTNNGFRMNRRGYVYATARADHLETFIERAQLAERQGAGPVRIHPGPWSYEVAEPEGTTGPPGFDLLCDPKMVQRWFPYLSPDVVGVLHVRRAGWFSGQQLGMLLLDRAREHGVRLVRGRVTAVAHDGKIRSVCVDGEDMPTSVFVAAGGPHLSDLLGMLGIGLPLCNELHLKASFLDTKGVIPRSAPLLIWSDSVTALADPGDDTSPKIEMWPPGAHLRPEGGGQHVLALWDRDPQPTAADFPVPVEPHFCEIALHGLGRMIPALRAYEAAIPPAVIDGGYYTKTPENRLLSGPLPIEGAFVLGAMSGYGLMAACGAAELLAAWLTRSALPAYAPAFAPSRYDDPEYRRRLTGRESCEQL